MKTSWIIAVRYSPISDMLKLLKSTGDREKSLGNKILGILGLGIPSIPNTHIVTHGLFIYFFSSLYLFINEFFCLVVPCGMQDLSFPTRDWTCAPCSRSAESYPLDCQGSPFSSLQRWDGLTQALYLANIKGTPILFQCLYWALEILNENTHYIQWDTTQPLKNRMKFCHLQQCGWTLMLSEIKTNTI